MNISSAISPFSRSSKAVGWEATCCSRWRKRRAARASGGLL
jgi:hypothetical protein